jgi:hypothetical protein
MRMIVAICSILVLSVVGAGADTDLREIVGSWNGSTRIIVSWCEQSELIIAVNIHPNGSVTGEIGDAELLDGSLVRNGWLTRILGSRNDWIIEGALGGPIVEEEGIARKSVKIPLRLVDGELHGGLHTSGWTFGGKESGVLSTSHMVLRQPASERKM